jgi:hypothetical protein
MIEQVQEIMSVLYLGKTTWPNPDYCPSRSMVEQTSGIDPQNQVDGNAEGL